MDVLSAPIGALVWKICNTGMLLRVYTLLKGKYNHKYKYNYDTKNHYVWCLVKDVFIHFSPPVLVAAVRTGPGAANEMGFVLMQQGSWAINRRTNKEEFTETKEDKETGWGTSQVVRWFKPWSGNRSHMPRLRIHMPKLKKILQATT